MGSSEAPLGAARLGPPLLVGLGDGHRPPAKSVLMKLGAHFQLEAVVIATSSACPGRPSR